VADLADSTRIDRFEWICHLQFKSDGDQWLIISDWTMVSISIRLGWNAFDWRFLSNWFCGNIGATPVQRQLLSSSNEM